MPTFETDRSGLLWNATAVPNAFFCEYMPSAPESHVKVYLYGLMCAMGGVPEEGDLLDDVARLLNLERAEAERAMRYWERCHLVERIQDIPPRYRFLSVQQAMLERREIPRDEAYEAFAQAVYAAFGDRRKLHGGETVLAYEWVEQLKLPPEVVLMLIQHMIAARGVNFSFKAAQKLAVELSEQRVFTIDEAEAVFNRSEAAMRGARRILNHLGMRRSPTMDEIDLYQKWTEKWSFAPEAIEKACRETTKGSPNFGYLDKVLEGIRERSGGETGGEKAVGKRMKADDEENRHIREVLAELGMSMQRLGSGVREVYRDMAMVGGHEVVVLAAKQVARSRMAHTLDNVAGLLSAWSEKGLTTVEAVERHLAEVKTLNAHIRVLMERAGHSGGYTQTNRDLLRKWQETWRIPDALVELAADFARTADKPMPYMDKLLSGWRDAGVDTVEAARAEHERRQQAVGAKPVPQGAAKRVIEQQYEQREYDPEELDGLSPEQLEEMNRK